MPTPARPQQRRLDASETNFLLQIETTMQAKKEWDTFNNNTNTLGQFVTCPDTKARVLKIIQSRWGNQLTLPRKYKFLSEIWFLKYLPGAREPGAKSQEWHTDGPGKKLKKVFSSSISWGRGLDGGDLLIAAENYADTHITRIPADRDIPQNITLFDGNGLHAVDAVKHGLRFALVVSLAYAPKVHE